MALIVHKYGGTSVGSIDRIKNVAKRIKTFVDEGHQIVVVVSAMSGETNKFVDLYKEILKDTNLLTSDIGVTREIDTLLSTGEQVTISLLSLSLQAIGVAAKSYTGWQIPIMTDTAHTKARIEHIKTANLQNTLDKNQVAVVAGFQGVASDNSISTLGRGGSDTTAVAIAAALEASECQIYTDVDGVYTTDPRSCKNARKLDIISYDEMLEIASLGAKVLQLRSVEFASKYNVPLRVLSSLKDQDDASNKGTLVTSEDNIMEKELISGIPFSLNEAKLTITRVPNKPGVAYGILGPISDANIEVDMIVQNVSVADNTCDFTFTVQKNDMQVALEILEQTKNILKAKNVIADDKVAKVSLVGIGMKSHAGIASRMFKVLADNNINIQMIGTTEIKISVIINSDHLDLAVNVLHNAFELDKV